MIIGLIFTFYIFLLIFLGTYLIYFISMEKNAKKPWRLRIDKNFTPKISILIPVHNEEQVIETKLRNIKEEVIYPRENIEVIIADDASEDKTLMKVKNFKEHNKDLNIKIVSEKTRLGKSHILNKALEESTHDIVVVSDADTLWSRDILRKALLYLADSRVGAITGRGLNLNANQSWVIKCENTYLHFMSLLRLGESKIHSTIKFEGGFCAFKKEAFDRFDCETGSDDWGTALKVVQSGYKTIFIPEAIFYTNFPARIYGKIKIKTRRANQLISVRLKCLRLLFKRQLLLPKKIVILDTMLNIVNPFVFFILAIITGIIIVLSPFSLFSISCLLLILTLSIISPKLFFEVIMDNIILLYTALSFLLGKRYIAWDRTENQVLSGDKPKNR